MKLLSILLPAVALAASAQVAKHGSLTPLPLPHRIVHQFPEGTWLENIAVRSNGDLIVTTLLPSASLYQVSNPTSLHPVVNLVRTFDSVNGLVGITETNHDVFTVLGGNFSSIAVPVTGSFSAWEVDFNHPGHCHREKNQCDHIAKVRLNIALPRAVFPNGAVALPHRRTTVLIADSTLGLVWRLDTLTGQYGIAVQVPEMAVVPGSPFQLGVNGVRIAKGYLYWTNSFAKTLHRIRIGPDGEAVWGAKVELVVSIPEAVIFDDFAIGADGVIWIEDNAGNRVFAVQPDGEYVVAVGALTELTTAGATAAAFGRGKGDKSTLYVVTSGALAAPVNGTLTEGGKVVAVNTQGFSSD